jgi:hypothetical protein
LPADKSFAVPNVSAATSLLARGVQSRRLIFRCHGAGRAARVLRFKIRLRFSIPAFVIDFKRISDLTPVLKTFQSGRIHVVDATAI